MNISALKGDITTLEVDAIVNPAGPSLGWGKTLGGLDAVIHRAAGPELLTALRLLGTRPAGEAVATAGFSLPAKWVIHTVGPKWKGGTYNEAQKLALCYANVLMVGEEVGAKSIAIPAISTGAYRFPANYAAEIAVGSLLKKTCRINEVILVAYDDATLALYKKELAKATK